jgi:2-octaprenyl-6-methoxyphenol hydroxylase
MSEISRNYDILISGGGLVGASLALALAPLGYRIGIVEARPFGAPGQPSYDERSTALAWGSRRILEGLGIWPALARDATPILQVHVSQRGRFGVTRLTAGEEGVPALGYVAPNRCLGAALNASLTASPVELIAPARATAVQREQGCVVLQTEGPDGDLALRTRLLVVADGTQSRLRGLLDIPVERFGYAQSAVIANVTPTRAHAGIAYERFTDTGPLALLPLSGGRCSLVWTQRAEEAEAVLALDDELFLARLGERFGSRLGRFLRVGERAVYPLERLRARHDVQPRVAVVGNAAHTLHPVAGQGFNLALRDVAVLAEHLSAARRQGRDPGELALLEAYSAERRPDIDRIERYTDLLARVFVPRIPGLGVVRGAGLLALDLLPALRHRLARQSMGLHAARTRLARGLPLVEERP